MKDAILLELARRWEWEAATPETADGAPEAQINNAIDKGKREAMRACVGTIRSLVQILGTD